MINDIYCYWGLSATLIFLQWILTFPDVIFVQKRMNARNILDKQYRVYCVRAEGNPLTISHPSSCKIN